ncbi:MAG TPA: orotate phosphoribosyltransferase [Gemmatimonadetes bacterium]|uniref:orotate phosphoribosyltransferase n=1 Tax=marine metagenome TaxID=408172 RepID=A0A381PN01_9ZZZZ|nr:orotate phosphoribosyltransferase [Gemmatimonadota bacterium]|tara:strand:- start:612 stop:1187 length:576 start_codon:yes stop_codon:yes gene_type:complete
MNAQSDRKCLKNLLLERSVRLGDFTLSSGAKSSYYIDARQTTMTAEGQRLTGKIAYTLIEEAGWDVSHVGGLTLGADPVAYAIAHHSTGRGRTLDGFTVRKEPKDHGTGQQIEGGLPTDARVVVVEDAVTTGGSAIRAIEVLRKYGASVAGVICLVDREEGGRSRLDELGVPLLAVFTGPELLAAAEEAAK